MFSETPCAAAALFTQNRYAAAPVVYDRRLLEFNPEGVQAVLINSGNANAVTGVEGLAAVRRSAEAVEATFGLPSWSTLIMSTGVIGVPLPVERIEAALPELYRTLRDDAEGFHSAAASHHDHRHPPQDGRGPRRSGRGNNNRGRDSQRRGDDPPQHGHHAGVDPHRCRSPARRAAASAPGCDRPLLQPHQRRWRHQHQRHRRHPRQRPRPRLLASRLRLLPPRLPAFSDLLTQVCVSLAQAIVRDGEGAAKFVTIQVAGLDTDADAHRIANAIAISPLVKTAIYGGDANWGRILAAAGNSGVAFDPTAAELWITGGPQAERLAPAPATCLRRRAASVRRGRGRPPFCPARTPHRPAPGPGRWSGHGVDL